ncbi:uncharacterized protein LOC132639531 [Lycium barbarum]|uniref:uncharacterized protein LOC132639531 n=1 Tax=Lycium barbarum TaxID=112863 RepID=UPI00293E42D9|nr:uncharacterized protein LOC132639531 [Lycium barbarum]
MIWKIQNGHISFWWDNWTGYGAIVTYCPDYVHSIRTRVRNFIIDNEWDLQSLGHIVTGWLLHHIASIKIGSQHKKDYLMWKLAADGVFSNKEAWNGIRTHRKKDLFVDMPVDCLCCSNAQPETIQHFFIESEPALFLWKYFGQPLGISYQVQLVRAFLHEWWQTRSKNEMHKMIIHVIPVIICWIMWINRCSCRYGDQKKFYIRRMQQEVIWYLKAAMDKAFPNFKMELPWLQLCEVVEKLKPRANITQVTWSMPTGKIKVNTDGSYNNHGNRAGIGGIARDEAGSMIFAFAIPVQGASHNMIEAMAIRYAAQWIKNNGYRQSYIESDSLMIVEMLTNRTSNNLTIKDIIEETMNIGDQMEITFKHCYREGNQTANFLAKFASSKENPSLSHNLQQMPRGAFGAYYLDKSQMPSMRIRYDKANVFVS